MSWAETESPSFHKMDLMLEMHDGNTEVYEIICQIVILALKVRLTAKKKKPHHVFQLGI